MDVNEQERLSNITLRHKLNKGTACTLVHLHPYPFLLQAVPLLKFVSKCNVG
jgi:hypothetical protein